MEFCPAIKEKKAINTMGRKREEKRRDEKRREKKKRKEKRKKKGRERKEPEEIAQQRGDST